MNIINCDDEAIPYLYEYQKLLKLSNPSRADLRPIIRKAHGQPKSWCVEKLDGDGQTCHGAAFTGPLAMQRAIRYSDQEYRWRELPNADLRFAC
jgi:hypothetical protein